MGYILTTERLWLREFLMEDAPYLYALNFDQEVIKYTGDPPFASLGEARDFVERYDHYFRHGYGRWTIIEQANLQFVGWCGLKYHEDTGEVDLGFRLLRTCWNQGFATEAARACLRYGFEQENLESIIGRAVIDNTASIRVLVKLGFSFSHTIDAHGMEAVQYRLTRKDWENQST